MGEDGDRATVLWTEHTAAGLGDACAVEAVGETVRVGEPRQR